MRNTKKGVNAGRNESARRRMNRGGLINEIEVEYWRVIDELRRHFVIKCSYIFFYQFSRLISFWMAPYSDEKKGFVISRMEKLQGIFCST